MDIFAQHGIQLFESRVRTKLRDRESGLCEQNSRGSEQTGQGLFNCFLHKVIYC